MKIINYYLTEGTLPVPENWSKYDIGPVTSKTKEGRTKYEWIFYQGGNDWQPAFLYQAVYSQKAYDKQGEQSRIWIEIKYPDSIDPKEEGSDSDEFIDEQTEFGELIAKLWIKKAKRLRAEHTKLHTEYSKALDSENDKLDKARKQGKEYERKLPDTPKYKGNWADAFAMALTDSDLSKHIKQKGIDSVDWIASKRDIKDYGLE